MGAAPRGLGQAYRDRPAGHPRLPEEEQGGGCDRLERVIAEQNQLPSFSLVSGTSTTLIVAHWVVVSI